ncbi:helix-turn-helix domain-containing protein [Xanthomonas euvesicatoria pv. eucalypti]|uniref:TetR/AcrR family transcriptional regulator n=1 Tax=Xanthomonas TaxID=338 RepID=UPI001C4737C5|nr:TetR/AcrR family transcriptional regulator [Xanthomonas euvesicatoria]MBV6777124.1 TetR/AcrR family transcriptional regulator [Xanthomonas campestris pv. carissae]MBV6864851.1 TetR/AcrR family transcriptional regulator [Xanthomonas campestris pv. coriandri]MCE4328309.1 TetR/AcrR family transcriptional regulator [Xanthomonas campestris pv. coriandri]MCP3040073.1 TetR/AcrR family transcriptional regulator [Xanthomonas euvesicatoria pv. allii]MCP3052190.1 TetR/AcrR family transcriptional regul
MTADTPLRADAQRNRERLLAAAEEVFLERGAEASMEDVAKRAGVGIGTLYRRFPTRESLFAAAYSGRFLSLANASHARASSLDALTALRAYLEDLALHTSVYRGLAASLGAVLQSGTPGCEAVSKEGQQRLRSAQNSGVVRCDVCFDDLVVVAIATSLATEQHGSPKTRIAHLIGLFVDGIAAPRAASAA